MEPGLGMHWGYVGGSINVVTNGECVALTKGGDLFRIPLLHHTEAAKLALNAIEVAVVVGVAGGETIAADVVVGFNALDYMHRKR